MDLRYAEASDDVAGLWREVFGGDEGKVYFVREFDPARTLIYEDSGRVISMLHWTNQHMRLWGTEVPCAYIMGVGTSSEHRGKGLAGDLIEQVLFELHLRKMPLCCLIPETPSLAGWYAKYGFVQVGAGMRESDQTVMYPKADKADIPELNRLYERLVGGYPHMARPRERWEVILEEYDVGLSSNVGYGVYNSGAWLEGTGGLVCGGLPNAACVKTVELKFMAELAAINGKPLPVRTYDEYCPWNGTDNDEDVQSAETLWFSKETPYINLLYN